MGSPPEEHLRDADEPQREVRMEHDFYLSETEVTAEQWARVMGSAHEPREEGLEMPVNNTTWYEAVEFVERLNAMGAGGWRLPSEAEWEYACRAGTTTPFAFGEDVTPLQVHYNPRNPYHRETPRGTRPRGSIPVRTLPPNPWGFYGMHGNVQEWCEDLYLVHPDEPPAEPPEEGDPRVFKGGAWVSPADQVRSAYRDGYPPKSDGVEYGFRVARSVEPRAGG
jgi:formylglycine-generating enzyme required for sulfatase activity